MKETVESLEAEQKEKLKEWQDKMRVIYDFFENAEKVVTEKSVVGADINTVKSQKEILQVCFLFIYQFPVFDLVFFFQFSTMWLTVYLLSL